MLSSAAAADAQRRCCLLLPFIALIIILPTAAHSLALDHKTTTTTTARATKTTKKNLPASERARRRKSPALWRQDLCLQDDNNDDVHVSRLPLERPPEVMAPAGGWPQLRAAVANGADSVYLGLSSFSARARASNFSPTDDDLFEAVRHCHRHDVQVYVALNTLVFDDELEDVSKLLQLCRQAHVDAVIVQDVGVAARLAAAVVPDLPLHASTQQTVTSADGARFAAGRGRTSRVVVGRELSLDDIRHVVAMASSSSSSSSGSSDNDVEVEAFVHGALCVSYSGQCFSSEAWGGRSANRGQCAQACRLPYGLVVNGELRDLLQDMVAYLLSPQDLCGLEQVPALVEAGVRCLKIEGRLKDAAYVAATTRAYRNAVDRAWAARTQRQEEETTPARGSTLSSNEEVTRQELVQLFSRGQDEQYDGLTPGFFEGTQHQMIVRGRSPRHRGVHVGRVQPGSSWKNGLIIQLDDEKDLKLGDGLVVDRAMAEEEELGGPIFDIDRKSAPGNLVIRFGREVEKRWRKADESARRGMGSRRPLAPVGAHVWKTSDAAVEKKMRRLSESAPPKMLAKVRVSGTVGEPLTVMISTVDGTEVRGCTEGLLAVAETSGLAFSSKVSKAIGTLGNTRWVLDGDVDVSDLSDDAWCPVSWIKEARRKAVEELEKLHETDNNRSSRRDDAEIITNAAADLLAAIKLDATKAASMTRLSVLARTFDQVDAVCRMSERGAPVDEVIVDFLEAEGMREAVERINDAGIRSVLASPRIIKPGESGIWRTLLRLEPDALLVRSTGLLYRMTQMGGAGASVNIGPPDDKEHWVKVPELIGDFSLNVANALTAVELLDAGLERVTASYDLSAKSITSLATLLGTGRAQQLEIVAHAKLPIFHTEHCVFARFLSKGNSYLDCGHVCTRNNVHLRDETGADNLVLADLGCRNTVFAAQAQTGVHSIRDWVDAGVGRVRVELVDEDADDSEKIVSGYLDVLAGKEKPRAVYEMLKTVRDSNGRVCGVTLGSFRNTAERKAGAL